MLEASILRPKSKPARALVIGVVVIAVAVAADACVIADPPLDLPQLPAMRPTILRGSVVPSASSVLGTWPAKFTVPVELVNPRATFWFSAFVDYNPATGAGLVVQPERSEFERGSTSTKGRVRTLEIPVNQTPSPDRCHIIEIVVALEFVATTDSKNSHTPREPGGDSVTWFYNPSGDLAGCPVLDAGLEPDAEAGPP